VYIEPEAVDEMRRFRVASVGRRGGGARAGASLSEMQRQRSPETVARDAVNRYTHPDERELAPDQPAHTIDLRTAANAGCQPVSYVPHLQSVIVIILASQSWPN